MKKIIVKSGDWKKQFTIDEKIFSDVGAEACTQAVEHLKQIKCIKLAPIMECQMPDKTIVTYNSYKILVNASMHKEAKLLRNILIKSTKIDWHKEPLKAV